MNDNRYKTKLHVSSETRKGSGDDTNEFRFDLPHGVSHLKKVTITEAEIVNAMTPIHQGNDKVCFNEFNFFVEYPGNDTEMSCDDNPRLYFTSTMYEGNIPHANYDLDSMVEAISTAMNTAVAVWDSLGQTLPGLPCLNHYTVTRPPFSNSLLPIITATPFTQNYSEHTQLFDDMKMHETDFAVRRGNLPTQSVTGFGTWNPYNKNPIDNVSVQHTNSSIPSITNLMHCSPYRVVMNVSKWHQFIPGDPVLLSFDEIHISPGSVTLQPNDTSSQTIETGTLSTLDGFVAYVNDTELHVLVKGFSSQTLVLQNCVIRLNNGISEFQQTGCAQLGLGKQTRQGLLVSSRVGARVSTETTMHYDARVHANAATDYMAFKDSTNPFAGGGTAKVVGTSQGRLALSSTRYIFYDTNVNSSDDTITLGDVSSLNVDDRVIYECSGATGKISELIIGTQYFIHSIDMNNQTIKLKESPGTLTPVINITQPTASAQHSILIAPFKLTSSPPGEHENIYCTPNGHISFRAESIPRVIFRAHWK